MSAKFKPKKKEAEPIVDDWEAAESVEEEEATISSRTIASSSNVGGRTHQDAWEQEKGESSYVPPKVDGKTLWQEANRDAPQPQPLLSNRSLPPTVLSPRLYNASSSSTGDYQNAITAPPPPQILRREKIQYSSNANDKNNEKKKTMKEREEEYKRARERIFGSSSKSTPETSLQQQQRQSPSADSTKNRDARTKS